MDPSNKNTDLVLAVLAARDAFLEETRTAVREVLEERDAGEPALMDRRQAAAFLGISLDRFRRLENLGLTQAAVPVGARRRYHAARMLDWLSDNRDLVEQG